MKIQKFEICLKLIIFELNKNDVRLIHKLLLFFFFTTNLVISQDLLPFVENFSKTDYNGDNQVWNATQSEDNSMYFANNHYFLRYNGVKWEKYILPNKTIIRAVFADKDKVYCGSYNEFGYWKRIAGKMYYYSLSANKKLFNDANDNEEIWKIFKFENDIYFQSFNQIFILKNNTIETIKSPFQISYCFVVGKKIYVASVKNGVFILENNKCIKIQNWSKLNNTVIHGIEKINDITYIFTQKKGVFISQNQHLTPWDNALNELLKKELIITARALKNNKIVIGTAFHGLYIVDLNDNSVVNLSRSNSIKNNSVLNICFDNENDLWLGLDNGISHIEINSPFQFFSDNTGVLGSVYSLSTTKNGYLLGSNHGLFEYENKKLKFLSGSEGQVWDIKKVDNKFIIGHNEGTFSYDYQKLKKENTINGGWELIKSKFENAYFQANYSGIIAYFDSDDFSKFKRFEGIIKPIKYIAQTKPNELWAADNYKSLFKINYNNDFSVSKIENISKSNNIQNDYGVKLLNFKNEIFFLIDSKWYYFNSITSKLEINEIFNTTFKGTSQIISINTESFLVLKEGLIYIISQIDGEFVWELIPEKYYEGKIINNDTKVFENNNKLFINLDDGFFVFDKNHAKIKNKEYKIEGFYQGVLIDENTKIEHNQSIEVNLIAAYYGFNRVQIFYKLNNSKTYTPINKGKLILNNLNSGKQKLHFYFNNGKDFQPIGNYYFTVANPWYFSAIMIFLYLLVTTILFYLYYRWNNIKYLQKMALNEEELKHQKAILHLELDAAKSLKQQEIDKHVLEIQIQTKAAEVAGKSLSIAKQTELIDSIQKILDSENDVKHIKTSIKKSIKINAINKHEWKSFETNLMQSNEDFVQKLTKKYPNLSSKDIKLCIYLKMNLSSKEIAPLMSISFRGVELHRYRLRKKLEIPTDVILSKFLITV